MTHYTREALVLVLIIGAIGLVACSGSDDAKSSATATAVASTTGGPASTASTGLTPSASAQGPDVCSLVTRDEAAAYLGTTISDRALAEPIEEPVGSGVKAMVSACAYSYQPTGAYVKIDLWVASGQANQLKQLTQSSCDGNDEIPGLGDFACWYNAGHSELQFVKGDAYVHLTATTSGSTTDALKAIAATVLSRLP